jgi:hypothetical protein
LAEGVPSRIDKSVFVGQSGGIQSQLMAGLKFLNLITEDGTPTAALKAIAVSDDRARKEALQQILKAAYADLFKMDLTAITSAQLYEQMGKEYSCSGETREKAIRFFLAAVQYAGLPLGRLLLQAKAATGGLPRKARRTTTRTRTNGAPDEDDDDDGPDDDVGEEKTSGGNRMGKTVPLRSGGSVTVSAVVDMFSASEEDRAFLLHLVDKLKEYERAGEKAVDPPMLRKL